ncbi:MAG: hypothetical protein EPO27_10540 [Betaproteobacteria bacterium]|nr:MAG: hypothetical protein EPO27_10540 [Betaproteobacteria bacterium]
MAGITLAQAEAKLAAYLDAETAVLSGQEYTIGSRRLRRADLAEIREGVTFWNGKVAELSNGGAGVRVRGLTLG